MKIKTGSRYKFKDFLVGEHELSVENGLYGSNETRTDLKIVEFNGFMIRGVAKIVVAVDDFTVFRFYNADGQILAERMMKIYEALTVKNTSMGTLKYNFERVIA